MTNKTKAPSVRLEDIYPGKSTEELAQIEEVLERYLEWALMVFDAIEKNPERRASYEARIAAERLFAIEDLVTCLARYAQMRTT